MKKLLLIGALVGGLLSPAYAQQPGVNSPYNPVFAIPIDNKAPTYGASVVGLVPAASATDLFTLCGSATKVVRVSSVRVGGRATAAASVDISLILRSTANTGGTSTAPNIQKYDSQYPTATAVATAYTANPTVGTPVGGSGAAMQVNQLFLGNLTTGAPGADVVHVYGDRPASQIVLRGVAQCLAVNMNGQSASGGLMDISVQWTENSN